ncbi:CpaB family protein [Microtetraspora malaysiensis]|uniref:SAF domain-containing protein n=1 Tax=Microtetraspora malaysiensis TaxID=161358 RepID=A0ABW6T123_9ACTN
MLLGGIVVLACAFASAAVTLRNQGVDGALAVQRDLQAGHTLVPGDLRVVKGSIDADLVPAGEARSVVGRQLTIPLAAGALLARRHIGDPRYPRRGLALIGVAVKPGQYPPDLASGNRVSVSPIPGTGAGADDGIVPRAVSAVVTKVEHAEQPQNPAVVTLLLPRSDAQAIAAPVAQGLVTLMQISPEDS